MPDISPVIAPSDKLFTDPPQAASGVSRRPRYLKQVGLAQSYQPTDNGYSYGSRPSYYQLSAWDQARRKEPLIKQALDYIVLAVLAKVGKYNHVNKKIDKFVQANLDVIPYKKYLSDIIVSALWSGIGVSEIVWDYDTDNINPAVWIDKLVNYHPLQLSLVLNKYGVIEDGAKSDNPQFKSGIWVPAPAIDLENKSKTKDPDFQGSLVRLKRSKRCYITLGGEGSSPYGRSQLESVLLYHLFKEAYRDMLTTALDRYGTPLTYIIVPPQDTREQVENPDGSFRMKTLHEKTVEQIENLSSEAALVFTQNSKDQPIKVDALTTGNNFSDSFTKAIEFCDSNMLMGMGIPNLLFKDGGRNLGSGGASERQLEVFNSFISSIFDLTVVPFTQQVILQLIQYNFDPSIYSEARNPGTFTKKPSRSTELKTVVESIKILTDAGFINPSNQTDFNFTRDLIDMPERDISSQDKKQVSSSRPVRNPNQSEI